MGIQLCMQLTVLCSLRSFHGSHPSPVIFFLFGGGEWGRKGEEKWESRLARDSWHSTVKTGRKGEKPQHFFIYTIHTSFPFFCFLFFCTLFFFWHNAWEVVGKDVLSCDTPVEIQFSKLHSGPAWNLGQKWHTNPFPFTKSLIHDTV